MSVAEDGHPHGRIEMCGVAPIGHRSSSGTLENYRMDVQYVARSTRVTQSRMACWMHLQSGPLGVMPVVPSSEVRIAVFRQQRTSSCTTCPPCAHAHDVVTESTPTGVTRAREVRLLSA